jgi:hypothetical protein
MTRLLRLEVQVIGLWLLGMSLFVMNAVVDGDAQLIQSDGEGYYAWARSVLLDGDVDFTNEYGMRLVGEVREERLASRTPLDLPINKYSVGLPLIEAFPTALALGIERALHLDPGKRPGYGPVYQWSVAVFLLTFGLFGVYRALLTATREGPKLLGALLCLGSLGGSNLVEYVSRGISMTHLMDVALIATAWHLARAPETSTPRQVALGFVTGLAVMTRFTNIVAVPWLIACVIWSGKKMDTKAALLAAVGGAVPVGAQVWANLALWGRVVPEPYPGEHFDWLHPELVGVLMSSEAGWWSWNPWNVVLLVLVCLSWPYYSASRAGRFVVPAALVATLALTYVNAAWWCWTFGFGYGHRGFLVLWPVLTLTVAPALPHLLERWRMRWSSERVQAVCFTTVAVLVAWNAYVWTGFNVHVTKRHGSSPTLTQCVTWPTEAQHSKHKLKRQKANESLQGTRGEPGR